MMPRVWSSGPQSQKYKIGLLLSPYMPLKAQLLFICWTLLQCETDVQSGMIKHDCVRPFQSLLFWCLRVYLDLL